MRTMISKKSLLLAGLVALLPGIASAAESAVAVKAYGVLKKYCYKCHGTKFEVPGFDVLNREGLLARRPNEKPYVTPGEPEESALWYRVAEDKLSPMPPEDILDRPSAEEIKIFKQWIVDGAESWGQARERSFIPVGEIYRRIRDDLIQNVDNQQRERVRYFSLVHLHNNTSVTEEDLRIYRAALVKTINSLSRKAKLVEPVAIDAPDDRPYEGTIYRISLDDVGWPLADWQQAIKEYPYGLSWNDPEIQRTVEDINRLNGGPTVNDNVEFIRADWFVAKATRPEAYHLLLAIPETVDALEERLGVDVQNDFLRNLVRRAGFAGSGVSRHNRLIDRHEPATTKYYYRSYDFGKSFGRGVLFRFPLGPKFDGNPFNESAAFEHDGGEIIWQLPNGMQGYMLIDGAGDRIDKGPIDIVRDLNETSGTPEVVNAISCIGCHRHGLHSFKDTIGESRVLADSARRKIANIFTPNEEMQEIVEDDRQEFLRNLDEAIGPYLKQGVDAEKRIEEFPEPVTIVARNYDKDLDRQTAARELYIRELDEFNVKPRKMIELGLGPLDGEYGIPRNMWDSRKESPSSVYQRAAVELGLGSGKNP